jgi:hypothetical protein
MYLLPSFAAVRATVSVVHDRRETIFSLIGSADDRPEQLRNRRAIDHLVSSSQPTDSLAIDICERLEQLGVAAVLEQLNIGDLWLEAANTTGRLNVLALPAAGASYHQTCQEYESLQHCFTCSSLPARVGKLFMMAIDLMRNWHCGLCGLQLDQ